MRNFKFYTFSTALVLILNGCGGGASDSTEKESADVVSYSIPVTVLGTTQEWQKDPVQRTWTEANSYCRSLSLDGKNDWRLPSSKEFFSLLDTNQSIDALFPKVSTIKEFWSSSETSFDINKAWKINAWSNSESYTDKSKVLGVRCIRGEELTTHSFTQESTTLKDTFSTGEELRWQDDNDSSKILVTYDEAKNYCQAKSQRLPNIFELQNMVDKQNLVSPFKNLNNSDFTPYWSSTSQPTNPTQFLTLNFMTGGVSFSDKNAKNFVRCVENINHPPSVINSQSIIVNEDGQTTITLEGVDIDNDTLSVTVTKMPDHGSFINNIYTPQANYYGTDSIKYRVSDGELESEEATITITINPINDIPVANNINTSTNEDNSKDINLSIVDIDNSTFTYTVINNPTHGTLTGTAPNLIYTPDTNYFGTDTFTYKANDGIDDSNIATVTITIGADNDAPTATPLTVPTNEDTAMLVTLSGSDPEGSTLSYQIISQPTYGILTGTAPNLTYTPETNYYGTDTFEYRVNDGNLDSPVVAVNISIASINDAPIASSDTVLTNEDVAIDIQLLANDEDNDTLTYTYTNPAHGTLTGTAPNLIYTPDINYYGTDTFSFYVSDGTVNSSSATIDINIASINDAPIADAGNNIIADEGTNIFLDGSNSSDIDGSIVSYLWREGTTELSTNSIFSNIFTPGTHTITLQVTDNGNLISTDTITITINSTLQSSFTPHTVTINAVASEWIEMVDLDRDGDLDILSASSGNSGKEIAWYENHGNDSFSEWIITSDTDNTKSIRAADMDNDGDIDILYTSHEVNGSLVLCDNNGSQNFTCSPIPNATDSLFSIEIVDQDGDGWLDIITSSCDNNKVEWIKNLGNGNFETPQLIDDANTNNAVAVHTADFNQDGYVDVVAAYKDSNRIDWYEYNSTGSEGFVSHWVADITDVNSIDIGDINQDGYSDIIAVSNNDDKVYWYKSTQSTSPTFASSISIASLINVSYASVADMDNDGDLDILSNSSETNGKIAWYENIGSDTNFPEHIIANGVDNIIKVFAADIDNDGNIDVVSGDSAGNIVVYENSTTDFTVLLPKTGDVNDGENGGDYNFLRDDTNNIVTDSLTGLMWQDDTAVSSGSKTWDELDLENGCNISLGGYSDWRFPNRHELYYLAQKGDTILDTTFVNISSSIKDYWTSSPNQIYVSFSYAISKEALAFNYTRCVRGEPITFNFIRDDDQEVVIDKKHKLMWEDGSDSDIKVSTAGWDDAKTLCDNLDYLGYGDWRLPNIHELYSIVNDNGLDKSFKYRGGSNDILISSTTYINSTTMFTSSTDQAYGVNVSTGLDEQLAKSDSLKFRCVRDIP